MDAKKYKVLFRPDDVTVEAGDGDNLLELARESGVAITAACGGDGVCGTCKVIIEQGEVDSLPGMQLAAEEIAQGVRLACQCRVKGDLVVAVPEGSRMAAVASRRALVTAEEVMAVEGWKYAPPIFKLYLELAPPTLEENSSDLTRLERELAKHGLDRYQIDLGFLERLPHVVREGDWKVTLTILKEGCGPRLTTVEAGDTRGRLYGLAFDIGTTGVRGELLDLIEGKVLSRGVEYNGQRIYGDDVISRIAYCTKPDGMAKLQQAVVATLNGLIAEMTNRANVPAGDVSYITIAGNTTMIQLLLAIDPKYLRLAPYVPAASLLPPLPARRLGLNVPKHVHLYTIPSVASYIGGDIVSGLVGTGIYQRPETVLYIDIGTNGETVVGNSDWMVSASCSAGPAFEGGGISCGMLATEGAIEGFGIDAKTKRPILATVGGVKPRGICGAGLISIVAGLLTGGIINQKGKFQSESTDRVRTGNEGLEYLLAPAAETDVGKDIVLTEVDIDNLIRAKAAMYAGYQTLLKSVGLSFNDLDRVIIAGTFGSHLDIEEAITIGLMPEIDRTKFFFVGNGSLLGARLSSFSTELIEAGRRVARMVTNIELSENGDFMHHYIASMFLPHTESALFPEATRRLNELSRGGAR
ncbi:MAG: ASKHA domain-containing protein [Syntrophales bacterium]